MDAAGTSSGRWRLDVERGRQVWVFDENPDPKRSWVVEDHLLSKKSNDPDASYENETPVFPNPTESVRNAIKFYSTIQTEDGHWAGDYGGPMFLLPGLVITCYIAGVEFSEHHKREMIRYLSNRQNKVDGGWGLHIEAKSSIFGTVMQYVTLRLLGLPATDERCVKALKFIHGNGGALGTPSWGKFWLCTLNVMEWEAMNPVPPELWWLPSWLPFHPSKYWCHCRVVYLPMAFVYGGRYRAKVTPLIKELRSELYTQPYHKIKWTSFRAYTAAIDIYRPTSLLMRCLNTLLSWYERFVRIGCIRRASLAHALDHIKYEDEQTKFICIGPVNKAIDMLSVWYAEGNSAHFRQHVERVWDYLWLSDDGMKMQGYNGSQLWDTAFATQAIIASGMAPEFAETLKKAHHYIDITQVREDAPNGKKYYRHISKGAWPFSTRDHGWPISDCTAEGLKATLLCRSFDFIPRIDAERLYDAINVCLSMQNPNGGWATYELQRGSKYLELLNPAEVFENIMVDYQYVECTSASIQALLAFKKQFPDHRAAEIDRAIRKGVQYIKSVQLPDGSWYGSWAVCFCYGTWFGVWGLVAAMEAGYGDCTAEIQKACKFLVSKQMADGGWGESYLSSETHVYVPTKRSLVINTAWALLALMKANYHDHEVIKRGIQLLMRRQMPNGDFPQENISGVFNGGCMITYTNYRNIFPIWALGEYQRKYGNNTNNKN